MDTPRKIEHHLSVFWPLLSMQMADSLIQKEGANIIEPRHDKMCLREFPTRPDTNQPAQSQRLASLEILDLASIGSILSRQRTRKALIRLRRCTGWSAPLLFAYDVRHIFSWSYSYILYLNIAYDDILSLKIFTSHYCRERYHFSES